MFRHVVRMAVCLGCLLIFGTSAFAGDFNGDGRVSDEDIELFMGLLLSEQQLNGADINGDSIIDSADALQIADAMPDESIAVLMGEPVTTTQTSIGVAGGSLMGGTGTPIEGVEVRFPSGSLNQTQNVAIGYVMANISAVRGEPINYLLMVEPETDTEFQEPMEISIPIPLQRRGLVPAQVPVPYYVFPDGRMEAAQLLYVDEVENKAVFAVWHASFFSWLWEDVLECGGNRIVASNTGFKSADDGFQVVNRGTTYNTIGECMGMSAWAYWYWRFKKAEKGKFFPKYMSAVDSTGTLGQQVIATRAYTSIILQWPWYGRIAGAQKQLTPLQQMAVIRNALRNTAAPVLIYLQDSATNGAHSVLATSVKQLAGNACRPIVFDIYDPNHPGTDQIAVFNMDTLSWSPFLASGPYDIILYNGSGALRLKEAYESILEDADENFNGSTNATITITSHEPDETVFTRETTLTGKVDSGNIAITKLRIFVDASPFDVTLQPDGTFSQVIPIHSGRNFITAETKGVVNGNQLVVVQNTYSASRFVLHGELENAAILVTLTWSTNNTDLDMYVIDPTGDFSAYYKKVTTDGGELDFDDTDGYGPEHWTLLYTDTVRFDEDYRVRCHYYSDHSTGQGLAWHASILLNEGTEHQTITEYAGVLGVSNPSNNQPTGTGPDWADIATVRPVMLEDGRIEWVVLQGNGGEDIPWVITDTSTPAERLHAKALAPTR